MKIIVTGATGMIGVAIVCEALSKGYEVCAIVRKNSSRMGNLSELTAKNVNIQVIECDIQDYNNLVFDSKYNAFIHTAWQGTDLNLRDNIYEQIDNITYTIDAVHAAKRAGCEVFISIGSQAECGRVQEKIRGDSACNPDSAYGIAKYAAGKAANLVAAQIGLRCCHARILSVYGKGMNDNTLIVYLVKKILAGDKPSLTRCEQLWDYIYDRDAARALLAIVEKGINGKTYPIGSGSAKPLNEFVKTIRNMIDSDVELGFGEKEYYPYQPLYLCADLDELYQDTGFKPIVSFEDGIRETIAWVKACVTRDSVTVS